MFGPCTPEELSALGSACEQAGYSEQGLLELFGPVGLPLRPTREMARFRHLTRQNRALDTLARLFLLGLPVSQAAALRALDAELLESCLRWGLLERHGEDVCATVRLLPYRGLLLAADQAERPEIALRADQVMGITASTAALADFTVRQPARATLDLGTGCGVQAFLAARHSGEVVATDTNPRALEFACFNARLNNITNVCFIQGDGFQPVLGRRFDLVVVNPPFAISPAARYLYRDSGLPGDSFCQRLVREAPGFLHEGGFFQMTLDWAEYAGQDWRGRLAEWFQDSGCDAWVLRLDRHAPAAYAYMWVHDTEPDHLESAGRLFDEWVSYFEREGIEAVSTGLIALRRSPRARHWLRIEEGPEQVVGRIGPWVLQGFLLQDFLDDTDDAALLDHKLRLSPDVRLTEECQAGEGRWRATATRIRLRRGLLWEGNLDSRLSGLLARLDGRRPLRDLLVHLAVELGVEPERLIPKCLPLLRDLIQRGFLLPEHFPAAAQQDEAQ